MCKAKDSLTVELSLWLGINLAIVQKMVLLSSLHLQETIVISKNWQSK